MRSNPSEPDRITVVVDTREQEPYHFDPESVTATRRALPAGDYSLERWEDQVAVERKTLEDLVGTVIRSRKRFRKGRGFDQWYGFLGAAADHWHPELFRNRHAVHPDQSGGYHLTEDLVDQSIDYIRNHLVASADVPFFLYLSFGACHFPYHVPPDYMGSSQSERRGRLTASVPSCAARKRQDPFGEHPSRKRARECRA